MGDAKSDPSSFRPSRGSGRQDTPLIGEDILEPRKSQRTTLLERAGNLRRQAVRVRELADTLSLEADRTRIFEQAETIDRQAAALESEAARLKG